MKLKKPKLLKVLMETEYPDELKTPKMKCLYFILAAVVLFGIGSLIVSTFM